MLYTQILKYVNICMLYSNSNKQKFWNVVQCAVTQLPLLVKKNDEQQKKKDVPASWHFAHACQVTPFRAGVSPTPGGDQGRAFLSRVLTCAADRVHSRAPAVSSPDKNSQKSVL